MGYPPPPTRVAMFQKWAEIDKVAKSITVGSP